MVDVSTKYREDINEILRAISENEEELEAKKKFILDELRRRDLQIQQCLDLKEESLKDFFKVGVYFIKLALKLMFRREKDPSSTEITGIIRPVEIYVENKRKLPEMVEKYEEMKNTYTEIKGELQNTKNQKAMLEAILPKQ